MVATVYSKEGEVLVRHLTVSKGKSSLERALELTKKAYLKERLKKVEKERIKTGQGDNKLQSHNIGKKIEFENKTKKEISSGI